MPGMSGIEVGRAARRQRPELPVLLASGYSEEVLAGATEFELVRKPYGAESLSGAIATAVGAAADRIRAPEPPARRSFRSAALLDNCPIFDYIGHMTEGLSR